MAKTRPVFGSMAMNAPCTSGTWRKDQPTILPSFPLNGVTCTTSPTPTSPPKDPSTETVRPSSVARRFAQATSSARTTLVSSSSRPSIPTTASPPRSSSTTAGCQPRMSRGNLVFESSSRQVASSVRCSCASFKPVPRQSPLLRSYSSRPLRSAAAARSCSSRSTVARIFKPPLKNASSPKLPANCRRISSVK